MGKRVGCFTFAALFFYLPAAFCPSWSLGETKIGSEAPNTAAKINKSASSGPAKSTLGQSTSTRKADGPSLKRSAVAEQSTDPPASANTPTVFVPEGQDFDLLSREPFDLLSLENIKPLYTEPTMPGEGVWESATSPRDTLGLPVVYRTFYRPSIEFPNAVAYMMVIDMRKVEMRFYVGAQEPAARVASWEIPESLTCRVMAITNALWMQRHSQGGGGIYRGKVIYPMKDEMATLIIYQDGSVDIREWGPDMPYHLVQDARQLRHLIVKNGQIVSSVLRRGRAEDSEIGLGFLMGKGGTNAEGKQFWYVAHRSAFGIREDGNLVFAIGHHISTKDLAKCMVLAGCQRAIHADANPPNIVANIYLRDGSGNLLRKIALSPEQSKYTLSRYDDGYTKDYFAFFHRWPSYLPNSPVVEEPVRRSDSR